MKKVFAFAALFAAVMMASCGGQQKAEDKTEEAAAVECTAVECEGECTEECCGECEAECTEECCGECAEAECAEAECCGECVEE